jgi:hypothetical protein
MGIFAAQVVSRGGLVISHKICDKQLDTAWYRGSSGLPKAQGAGRDITAASPDPDG